MYLKHVITAGILSAALAAAPAAHAQSSGSQTTGSGTSSSSSSQGTTSQGTSSGSQTTGTTPPSTSSSSQQTTSGGAGGPDQEAIRQHLGAAREALAELTKLPAATALQGEQRQQVAQFISDFNTFATATTDWRSKYDTVDHSLDQLLGLNKTGTSGASSAAPSDASASGNASASASTSGATGTTGTSNTAAAGGSAAALDPSIIEKLQKVRTELDGFEVASGDPSFVVEKIEKILDQASGGGGTAVGTSGSAAASGGSITLTAAQVQELRKQLDVIKAAAKGASK
jgi:hypothetical protein